MTKTEIEKKIAEVKAQGDALQKHNAQLMQQMEVNKVELAKVCGKIELLSEMLSELEKTPTEGENGEAKKKMQTRTITVDYARPRGYDVGYRAENNFTELSLPVPAELEGADSYRVYFESTVGEYLQTELLTPVDGYVTVKITSDVVPEPGNMAAQLVAFADGERVGYAPMITGSAKVSIPDGTERLSPSLAAEIALNTAARHSHDNKPVLDKFAETDGKPTYDGEALGGGTGVASTAEDVSYTNTQLPNVENVKTALDELVPKAHTHANKDTLDKLSDSNGKLQYNGSNVGLKGDKGADGKTPVKGTDYWTEADKAEIVADTLAALPTWTGGNY